MKENALVPKAPIDKQLEASIAWLDTVVAEVKKKINDDPKTVVNTIKQIEVYEMGSRVKYPLSVLYSGTIPLARTPESIIAVVPS